MIVVSRLNGVPFAVNPDLIERAEETPDTVLTLTDGTKLVIAESLAELVDRVREFRASVLAYAARLEGACVPSGPSLRLIPGEED